jgi:FecR-like protein
MKNKIYLIPVLMVFFLVIQQKDLKSQSFTSSNPHDSILFEGAKENDLVKKSDNCVVNVSWVRGHVIGTHHETKFIRVKDCGVEERLVPQDTVRRGQLLEKDEVEVGEDNDIETGDDGKIIFRLSDGSELVLGPNSKINISKWYCNDPHPVLSFISKTAGKIWFQIEKAVGGAKWEVKTEAAIIGNRGTTFAVENGDKTTTVKVYDGAVEFNQNFGSEATKSQEEQIKQLNEDFQNGKISMEEYSSKMKEFVDWNLKNRGSDYQVIVNAGYKSTITGIDKATEPEPFDVNADRWWEK